MDRRRVLWMFYAVVSLALLALGLALARAPDPTDLMAIPVALFTAVTGKLWVTLNLRYLAVALAGVQGLMLTLKPWLVPISGHEMSGQPYALSPFAERHLGLLIPGVLLCALAALWVAMEGKDRRGR